MDNRYAKAVTDPALNYAEKTLDYYMPSTAAMVEGQGAVTRLYNINKRVYTHVYDATFIQLTKLHLQFERMIEKMMSLRKLLEEMYTVHKNQVVSVVSENTLVQRCQTYLRENNWSMEVSNIILRISTRCPFCGLIIILFRFYFCYCE